MSSHFSAHKTPLEFAERIIEQRGQTRYDNLKLDSKKVWDKDYDKVIANLTEQILQLTQ
jgi:hypothetical protein